MGQKLEDEIKTSKFRNAWHKAILNLMVTTNHISQLNNMVFKEYNLTAAQYNVLRILRGQLPQPCTILSIRERMLDKMSDTSRIVERLRKAGLIDRISCDKDRRAVDVCITEKGLDLLNSMQKEEEKLDHVLSALSLEEAEQLNVLLEKARG